MTVVACSLFPIRCHHPFIIPIATHLLRLPAIFTLSFRKRLSDRVNPLAFLISIISFYIFLSFLYLSSLFAKLAFESSKLTFILGWFDTESTPLLKRVFVKCEFEIAGTSRYIQLVFDFFCLWFFVVVFLWWIWMEDNSYSVGVRGGVMLC